MKKLPGETPEEQNKNLQAMFREVFKTEKGQAVLSVILSDLHYFSRCTTEKDAALCDYAKSLIQNRLGFSNTMSLTERLFDCEIEK